MTRWYVSVTFEAIRTFSEDATFDVLDSMLDYGASMSSARDLTGGEIAFSVSANSPLEAANEASRIVIEKTKPILGDIIVNGLEVMTESAIHEELATPTFPEVVGFAEIADMAGVSRQRARQFVHIAGFPAPVIETAQGPLMTKAAVESWLEHRNRAAGRPKLADV